MMTFCWLLFGICCIFSSPRYAYSSTALEEPTSLFLCNLGVLRKSTCTRLHNFDEVQWEERPKWDFNKGKERESELVKDQEDLPSFDEWKQKQLAAAKENEKLKQLEAQEKRSVTDISVNNNANSNRNNYAAAQCGAKVLSTNSECQNPGAVLTENRDQYMIQPCNANKWFILELCDPIQLRQFEIANYELFSSLPEKFVISTSERYPAKEWKTLGKFHARNERTLQTFSLGEDDLYTKYVKVEMLSYYGTEHYCPLSVVRIFGIIDGDDDDDHTPSSGEVNGEEKSENERNSLLSSATDTMLSIMKKVLTPSEVEKQRKELQENQSLSNNSTQNFANETRPEEQHKTLTLNSSMYTYNHSWITSCYTSNIYSQNNSFCSHNPFDVCKYVKVISGYAKDTCPMFELEQTDSVDQDTPGQCMEGEDKLSAAQDEIKLKNAESESDADYLSVVTSKDATVPETGTVTLSGVVKPDSTQNPTPTKVDKLSATNTPIIAGDLRSQNVGEDKSATKDGAESAIGRDQEATPKEVLPRNHVAPIIDCAEKQVLTTDKESNQQKNSGLDDAVEVKDIYAEPNKKEEKQVVIEPTRNGNADTDELITRHTGKKETMLMKLKNRIKALELNLNLSSRYLEDLSQMYRRKMEIMYTRLNMTVRNLTTTSELAALRDKKQQQQISVLQAKLDNVTITVLKLNEGFNTVLERHILLMLIEALIFFLLLFWFNRSWNRRQICSHSKPVENSPVTNQRPKGFDEKIHKHRKHSLNGKVVERVNDKAAHGVEEIPTKKHKNSRKLSMNTSDIELSGKTLRYKCDLCNSAGLIFFQGHLCKDVT